MKIIVTIIPTNLVTKLSSFYHFLDIRNKNFVFSKLVVYSNEKYFCFLFIASCALLESHAKCNRLLLRNFLTCYSCSYYSFMILYINPLFLIIVGVPNKMVDQVAYSNFIKTTGGIIMLSPYEN